MSDYIRKQDAIDLWNKYHATIAVDAIEYDKRLRQLPAADLVPVVRCWECKYVTRWRSGESARKFGQVYECARGVLTCPDPNDFCCRGDRRE